MIVEIDRFSDDVLGALGECRGRLPAPVAGGMAAGVTLRHIVRSVAEEAAVAVVERAPLAALHPVPFDPAHLPHEDGSGVILLPDDYLRLARLRMTGWKRAVETAVAAGSPMARMQTCGVAGVRGNPERPVAVEGHDSRGAYLEYYSYTAASPEVEEALYVRRPAFDRHGGMKLPEGLYRETVAEAAWRAALFSLDTAHAETIGLLREEFLRNRT